MITLVSEMNIVTRVDSLLTNLKFPWETSVKIKNDFYLFIYFFIYLFPPLFYWFIKKKKG